MTVRAREWQVVVEALRLIGCYVVNETEEHVTLARPVTFIVTVRKAPVSPTQQRHICDRLSIDEMEWEAALDASWRPG